MQYLQVLFFILVVIALSLTTYITTESENLEYFSINYSNNKKIENRRSLPMYNSQCAFTLE